MSDGDLLTLCVLQEAGNQVPDGMAAVARVVLNRTRRKYASDGTIAGTILGHDQFSVRCGRVAEVRRWPANYQALKAAVEAIYSLNSRVAPPRADRATAQDD